MYYINVYLSLSLYIYIYRERERCIYLSIYLPIYLSIYLSISLSLYIYIYIFIYLSIYLARGRLHPTTSTMRTTIPHTPPCAHADTYTYLDILAYPHLAHDTTPTAPILRNLAAPSESQPPPPRSPLNQLAAGPGTRLSGWRRLTFLEGRGARRKKPHTHDGLVQPVGVVRIHAMKIPGSRKFWTSLCLGNFTPQTIKISSGRTQHLRMGRIMAAPNVVWLAIFPSQVPESGFFRLVLSRAGSSSGFPKSFASCRSVCKPGIRIPGNWIGGSCTCPRNLGRPRWALLETTKEASLPVTYSEIRGPKNLQSPEILTPEDLPWAIGTWASAETPESANNLRAAD